jgi:predicted O-linked N-acetylglucosamine transferase (SPINDLY family)
MSISAAALKRALSHHQEGRLAEAEGIYRDILDRDPLQFDCLHLLGVINRQRGDAETAIDLISRAIALNPTVAEVHSNLGNALLDRGRIAEAVSSLERAVALKPGDARLHLNLANALKAEEALDAAAASYARAAELAPKDVAALNELGTVLRQLGPFAESRSAFERALALQPDAAELHYNLGTTLMAECRIDAAAASFEAAIARKPDHVGAHINLGNARKEQRRIAEAASCYRQAAALDPNSSNAHYNLGVLFQEQGRMDEARVHHRRALAVDPDHAMAKLALCMAELRVLYCTGDEIDERRAAYDTALGGLSAEAATPEQRRSLAGGLGAAQPFFLAYQGRNDRELQRRYGALVAATMAERFPPVALAPPPCAGEPIRVGIVSGYFWHHSNWKIPIKGWLSQLDRRRFTLTGYHTGQRHDEATREAAALCNRFVQGPLPLARWREAIAADAPHVLIYPEVGMDPTAALLAAQRLAPVQCNSWGHPDTSGLPTLDYYLSSALMELPEAQEHYTETLIRLPNLSIYYEPVAVAPAPLTRAELGLREDSALFWCCQVLFKYLPQFDEVFPRIALAAGNCQFVFLETLKGRYITGLFVERLERAFAAFGLDYRKYCVLRYFPRQHRLVGLQLDAGEPCRRPADRHLARGLDARPPQRRDPGNDGRDRDHRVKRR